MNLSKLLNIRRIEGPSQMRVFHDAASTLGRLMEELEAEKRIKNRLPILTSSLSKSIPQWETAQDSVFLYKGER